MALPGPFKTADHNRVDEEVVMSTGGPAPSGENDAFLAKIAVGVDGSSSSAQALRWATALSAQTGSSVTAISAWHQPHALLMPLTGAPIPPSGFLEDRARRALSDVVGSTETLRPVDSQRVVHGRPRDVLCDASKDHDLLVLGRSANTALKRLWLGSTAAHCVRHAACPVVIAGTSSEPEREIVVAVDGSEISTGALEWALRLEGDHTITAVCSHDYWELDSFSTGLQDRFAASVAEMLDEVVEAAIARVGGGAQAGRQVRRGDPRLTLVDEGDPNALLVVGSRGHSLSARWALGSFAEYAVHNAPGSVAIWRPRSDR